MKMRYLLPIFVVAGLASQALAQDCTSNNGSTLYYCKWGGAEDNCWKLNQRDNDNVVHTCAARATACGAANLYVFSGSTQPSGGTCPGLSLAGNNIVYDEPGDPGEGPCLDEQNRQLFCQYDYGCMTLNPEYNSIGEGANAVCSPSGTKCTCSQLKSDPNCGLYIGANKETLDAENYGVGQKCVDHGGTWVGGKDPSADCNKWCLWASGCTKIAPDDCSGVEGDCTPTTTCAEAEANCVAYSAGGMVYTTSSCSTPILPTTTLAGLTVLASNGSLHISSLKETTVSLFDMQGKQVFGTKIAAGYNVLALKDQKMGVYYAVVQSGSAKQIVKVTVK